MKATTKKIEPETTKEPKRRSWRPTKMWEWAGQNRKAFANILPEFAIDAAMATCTLELRSEDYCDTPRWGKAVVMDMQTYGFKPTGLIGLGVAVQETSRDWIQTTSHDAVNLVLGCFGLTMDDVWNHFEIPSIGKIKVSLFDVVTALCGRAKTNVSLVVA